MTQFIATIQILILFLIIEPNLCLRVTNTMILNQGTKLKKIATIKNFVPPDRKPLSIADGEELIYLTSYYLIGDYKGVLTGVIALALRLGTGVFVLGWEPFGKQIGEL